MKNLVAWCVKNPVAVNLMMLIFIVGGIIGYSNIAKQSDPTISPAQIEVTVFYLGASPKEVEERVVIRIEEALSDLEGLKKITGKAAEGWGNVEVEILDGYDLQKAMNEVKSRVDAINNFPSLIERPIIEQVKREKDVIRLAIASDMPEAGMKELARKVRNEVAMIKGISRVELRGERPYEISIEISEEGLLKYNLSFSQVAAAIKQSSVNMPAGKVDNETGKIQLIARGQAYTGEDFEKIVLIKNNDGTKVLLGDVAKVVDGFTEDQFLVKIDGKNAIFVVVYASENPDVIVLSKKVRSYVKQINKTLNEGTELIVWADNSTSFESRIETLVSNGVSGLALVFVGLMLFLTPRLAFWVVLGILVSFMGTFFILPFTTVGLTMISLFSFILILGIVVDDAIIVGENIYRENQRGIYGAEAAIIGTKKVVKPVIFSALTTMIFFSPMLFVPGETRQFTYIIPTVVIITLCFSLIESLMMLPAHLRHGGEEKPPSAFVKTLMKPIDYLRGKADGLLQHVIKEYYQPILNKTLRHKGLTLSVFVGLFMIVSVGLQYGGHVGFAFMPQIPQDRITAEFTFPSGIPFSTMERAAKELEKSAETLVKELEEKYPGKNLVEHTLSLAFRGSAKAVLSLSPGEGRDVDTDAITKRWRELTPHFADAKDISFSNTADGGGGGRSSKGLNVRISGANSTELEAAGDEIKQYVAAFDAVYYVTDTADSAQTEAVLSLMESAENMDISLSDLGSQVRQAFYGEEVQRIARGVDDVKVRVRMPKVDRDSFDTLNRMRIRSSDGTAVPFNTVGKIEYRAAPAFIRRTNRQRTLSVIALIEETKIEEKAVIEDKLKHEFLPKLKMKYPNVNFSFGGGFEGQDEFMNSMLENFLKGLVVIYVLFAIAFKSYFKPFIIFTALPFGYMGAIIGHLIFGMNISIYSIMGIIAAMGVVINDNLVLMDYISQLREKGYDTLKAVQTAAEERFRPIFLTSFTTFIGLVPLMMETSVQAKFLIPTVVALAFGVLFATLVTLVLVPVLYVGFSRVQERAYAVFGKTPPNNYPAE